MALVKVQRSPGSTGSQQSDGEAEDDEGLNSEKSECFFAGKDTALVLSLKDVPQISERRFSTDSTKSTNSTQSNNSDIQMHLQSMFNLLRHEETLKMAVKLESQRPNRTRYLVIASRQCVRTPTTDRKNKIIRNSSGKTTTNFNSQNINIGGTNITVAGTRQTSIDNNRLQSHSNTLLQQQSQIDISSENTVELREKRLSSISLNRQSIKCDADKNTASGDNKSTDEDIEESCLLGIDCNERTTIGLVVPILLDTKIHLDGDGGFSVSVYGKTHIFKPVSVQAMWSALQTLHKVSEKARENNFYPGGPSHDWLTYYESHIESEQSCLNEWNAMDSLESRRPPSPDTIRNKPTAKEETESVIKMKLKEIMMSVDLDEVTSKYIRGRLEEHLDMDLGEYKSFIDAEMLLILGQMDAPTLIFDHVYLGSEWNASNLEELQKNGVRHILNVTREIDNFFPGMFDYFNVRVYDDEKTNLLKYWDNTFRYINRAKADGSKVLVHCKMGVSRSASVVIAYAMKAYNWEFQKALQHVKERRNCIKPNKNFLNQLETYSGMLDAMKNKEKLQRSKSETNLKSTKDARLLPGSEPTPLIQALNQSKSKSAGNELSGDGISSHKIARSGDATNIGSHANDKKHRRLLRRSSSTSPKSKQPHTTIVKQQSQSLENLTPERSVADEPKNVRFPGNNGENYSVTQNQVLHIQKNTPPLSSVRTIVLDLEAHKDTRKTIDDRKNLQFGRSVSHDASVRFELTKLNANNEVLVGKGLGSPVWTSSAKLITQNAADTDVNMIPIRTSLRFRRNTAGSNSGDPCEMFDSQLDNVFTKENSGEKRHSRKTHSWTAVGGSSIMRHASWGSGDNRCGIPMRNSSWSSYDTNRNTFQFNTSAIVEGEIHDLNMSNKTAGNVDEIQYSQNMGTVKRTKQKLEESTSLKKLCPDDNSIENKDTNVISPQKKCSNLGRSASTAGTIRTRHPNRCNSQEIVPSSITSLMKTVRRSDGSRPLNDDLFSASAPDSYTISDIENKNTSTHDFANDDCNEVVLRGGISNTGGQSDDQRISGNVQILKKNFEAKAGTTVATAAATATLTTTSIQTSNIRKGHQSLPSSPVAQHIEHHSANNLLTNVTTSLTTATTITTVTPTIITTTSATMTTTNTATPLGDNNSNSSSSTSSSCSSSVSESFDRNVKGLVNKYQRTTKTTSNSVATTSITSTTNSATINCLKQRPRSHYDNTSTHKSLTGKAHEYNEGRPPPAPTKQTQSSSCSSSSSSSSTSSTSSSLVTQKQQTTISTKPITEGITIQPPTQRRLQQHGRTHPLSRLSLPKQSLNTAAYNTM